MRDKYLKLLAGYSVQYTWRMSLILLALTVLLLALASRLSVNPGMTEMLPENNLKADEFQHILEEFDNASSIILLVKGSPENMKAYAEHVAPRIESFTTWVERVDMGIPEDFYRNNGLKLLSLSELENFEDLFRDPNLIPFLENLNDSFEKEYRADNSLSSKKKEQDAVRFLDGIQSFSDAVYQLFTGNDPGGLGAAAADAITIGETFFLSPDRKMMLITIEPTFNMFDDINLVVDAVNGIEELVKSDAEQFDVEAGLTGTLVLSRDEMEAVSQDSMLITLLALAGVFLLFVLFFRMWISPLLAVFTIILGIIWSLGIASLFVDTLNLMTVMMSVILVGLGIDFTIHIIASYTENRHNGQSVEDAMENCLLKAGPSIITGGLTTGSAFLTMMISDNRGMFEFGLVSGFGIVVTMIAVMLILPILLIIRERVLGKLNQTIPARDIRYKFLGATALVFHKRWIFTGTAILLITAGLAYRSTRITTDYNYLNMEPAGLESIILQDTLIQAFDLSTDYALFTADNLGDARRLTDEAREMSTSGWVESITDYLPDPENEAEHFHFVRNIRRSLNSQTIKQQLEMSDFARFHSEIERLEFNVIELQDLAFISGQDKVYNKAAYLVGEVDDTLFVGSLSALVEKVSGGIELYLLTEFHREFAETFKATVLEMANTEPLTENVLPAEIRARFVGNSGSIYLITVYPKQNVWEDLTFLTRFSDECSEVSLKATGFPSIFVELMDMIAKDGKKATWLALITVFLIMLLDFRNIRFAVIGMFPLLFGAVWMVGFMEFSGLQLTMLNIMAIPLIIGIGIDDGVHIIHRYRIEGNLAIVFSSTGKAVLLTSVTTMLGFGSLWFATYRGLGSMGIALFIGVGTCFLATIIILPLVLRSKERNHS